MGDSTQKQAQDAIDEMMEGSRRGTEQIVNAIRDEIAAQLSLLGIATQARISSDLERRLIAAGPSARPGRPAVDARRPRARKPPGRRRPPAKKAAPQQKAGPAKKAAPPRRPPAKKAAGQEGARQEGRGRRRRPARQEGGTGGRPERHAGDSTPSWSAAAWPPAGTRRRTLIDAGLVLVSGSVAARAARLVEPAEPIVISGPPPRFVGRGGEKLDAALDRFAVDVRGAVALDAGASTGGFTDCLLQRGAAAVVAVDVGRGQLHERLRRDPRVRSLEQTNVRTATLADLGGEPFRLVVADLSFISLRAGGRPAGRLDRARRRPDRPGETAVRGRPPGGVPGPGGDPRSGGLAQPRSGTSFPLSTRPERP